MNTQLNINAIEDNSIPKIKLADDAKLNIFEVRTNLNFYEGSIGNLDTMGWQAEMITFDNETPIYELLDAADFIKVFDENGDYVIINATSGPMEVNEVRFYTATVNNGMGQTSIVTLGGDAELLRENNLWVKIYQYGKNYTYQILDDRERYDISGYYNMLFIPSNTKSNITLYFHPSIGQSNYGEVSILINIQNIDATVSFGIPVGYSIQWANGYLDIKTSAVNEFHFLVDNNNKIIYGVHAAYQQINS